MLFKTQLLNSEEALNNWVKLDDVVPLTKENLRPAGRTPLYDRTLSLLTSVIYQRTEALKAGHSNVRWGILLITDGEDNESKKPASEVKTILDNMKKKGEFLKNLDKRAYGEDIWTPLAENSLKWEEKQMKQTQASPQPVTKPPEPQQQLEPPQPEQSPEKELHPLVADAGAFTEKDMNKSATNQDAHFTDPKHAAFAVFDGLGGNIDGEVASATASKYIGEALANIPVSLPLDQTEQAVRTAVINASNKLWGINEPRYRKLMEEYQKRRAPHALTNNDFAQLTVTLLGDNRGGRQALAGGRRRRNTKAPWRKKSNYQLGR